MTSFQGHLSVVLEIFGYFFPFWDRRDAGTQNVGVGVSNKLSRSLRGDLVDRGNSNRKVILK